MSDPLTCAAVATPVLVEGVKFLYSQAGELIKLRREKSAGEDPEPVTVLVPEIFEDRTPVDLSNALRVDDQAISRVNDAYIDLMSIISTTPEIEEVLATLKRDPEFSRIVLELRDALAAVLGNRLQLAVGNRATVVLDSEIDIGKASGDVVGLTIHPDGSNITSNSSIKIEEGVGKVTGIVYSKA